MPCTILTLIAQGAGIPVRAKKKIESLSGAVERRGATRGIATMLARACWLMPSMEVGRRGLVTIGLAWLVVRWDITRASRVLVREGKRAPNYLKVYLSLP